MTLPRVKTCMPWLGCDPEFFFKVNKRIVGAENFLAKEGFKPNLNNVDNMGTYKRGTTASVIIDGVQAELNPRPNTCRANLANEIAACFRLLKKELDKSGKKVEVNFDQSVKISKTELAKLDEENQKFGCGPSLNAHGETGVQFENVNPLEHRQRSAGGHIHIGALAGRMENQIKDHPEKVVKVLDIVVGNTCVLVDRDKGNKQRRKLYGAAGEYRLPKHGLEYRVLSNFWLQSYPLMSMAFGLTRLAMEIVADVDNSEKYYKALFGAVDMEDITKAINNNDFRLAYKNFKAIEPILLEIIGDNCNTSHFPFTETTIAEFHFFVSKIKQNGIKHWFDFDPLDHWCKLPEAHLDGSQYYLSTVVRTAMKKELAEKTSTIIEKKAA